MTETIKAACPSCQNTADHDRDGDFFVCSSCMGFHSLENIASADARINHRKLDVADE